MHEFVSFNRQILHPQQINIRAVSSAALYGKGVFTTVAIYDGQLFLWEKHWQRLIENAARLSIDLSDFSESAVKKTFLDLIEKNNALNARARLTFFDESSSEIWKVNSQAKTSLLITTADPRTLNKSFSLTVSSYSINSRSPLVNIKSCNYLENIYALREATRNGFDEAVRLNEKEEIVCACLANIFWIKDGNIFTPALKTGALRGTTREFISEKFNVYEVVSSLKEIESAETVFLTSSGVGAIEVKSIGEIEYKPNDVFLKIKKLFNQQRKIPQDSNGHFDI